MITISTEAPMRLDDPSGRVTVRHWHGWTSTHASYDVGTPGYFQQVGRDDTLERVHAGPYVGYTSMPDEGMEHIIAELRQVRPCTGCGICDRYRQARTDLDAARAEQQLAQAREALPRVLAELAGLDARLPHDPGAVWPARAASRRNELACWALVHGERIGMPVGSEWADGQWILYLVLPTGQVSWHVPERTPSWVGLHAWAIRGQVQWDGHTRADKASRITAYLHAS